MPAASDARSVSTSFVMREISMPGAPPWKNASEQPLQVREQRAAQVADRRLLHRHHEERLQVVREVLEQRSTHQDDRHSRSSATSGCAPHSQSVARRSGPSQPAGARRATARTRAPHGALAAGAAARRRRCRPVREQHAHERRDQCRARRRRSRRRAPCRPAPAEAARGTAAGSAAAAGRCVTRVRPRPRGPPRRSPARPGGRSSAGRQPGRAPAAEVVERVLGPGAQLAALHQLEHDRCRRPRPRVTPHSRNTVGASAPNSRRASRTTPRSSSPPAQVARSERSASRSGGSACTVAPSAATTKP